MNRTTPYLALATDYDGTIARHGVVDAPTHRALQRWKAADRKLLLVTGRELPDLMRICPFTDLFDRIVAENGALLFNPATGEKRRLAPEPPRELVDYLRLKGVTPLSIGHSIVATQETYRGVVLEAIEQLGLKWKIILNKGALMVLPHDVDKTTGLTAALTDLKVARADTVGVGDAENDQAFLAFCGHSAVVANALGFLKKQVHYVARASHGAGVAELIDKLLEPGLAAVPPREEQQEFDTQEFVKTAPRSPAVERVVDSHASGSNNVAGPGAAD
jgi:HAD superfamily hydrolase (TIGR01484 family)